jgi:CheY-like chemotaxis protein
VKVIEKAIELDPDVIVVDVAMPELDDFMPQPRYGDSSLGHRL